MNEKFYVGVYANDAPKSNPPGWIIGRFIADLPRKTEKVEIKYWTFPVGQTSHKPKSQKEEIEITLLLRGKIRGYVGTQSIEIQEGQYIVISPGVENNIIEFVDREAEGLTIKAPSLEGDTIRK